MICSCLLVVVVIGDLVVPIQPEPLTGQPLGSRAKLAAALEEPFTTPERREGAPLGAVIEFLSDKGHVPILINEKAFRVDRKDPNFDPRGVPVTLEKFQDFRFGSVLQSVCDQADAVVLVELDHLSVVPVRHADFRTCGIEPLTHRALVHIDAKKLPLTEITKAIIRQTGANVLISPVVSEKANVELTATMYNTPVKVAVELLAEMAEFAVIERGNVLLITTAERAKAWKLEHLEPAVIPRKIEPEDGGGGLGLPPLM